MATSLAVKLIVTPVAVRFEVATLLIVGGNDPIVIDLNQQAMAAMRAPVKLEIVANATHLFEEPGALEEVARLAKEWFCRHLPKFADGSLPEA